MVCGYFIWGDKTPVNYQIVLYLFSRIVVALIDMAYKKYKESRPSTPASNHRF
jgi:hypothetical protein